MNAHWPAIPEEQRPWIPDPAIRGSRADRLLGSFTSALPWDIAEHDLPITKPVKAVVASAHDAARILRENTRVDLTELTGALLRSESVAPSKIEHLAAGQVRLVQNWIDGSEVSPRDAQFVPPRPELVGALLDDLTAFVARSDLDPVVVAAVAHAQFETIHPLVDGNGRTGRALIHSLWRRLGLTGTTVIPVSTVLLADMDGYFDGLQAYRAGDIHAWITQFAAATARAAIAAQHLASEVEALQATWMADENPRNGSAALTLIDVALRRPVFNFDSIRDCVPGTDRIVYGGIDRLAAAGVLVEFTGHGRNRTWLAPELFALLERFEQSLGRRRRPQTRPGADQPNCAEIH